MQHETSPCALLRLDLDRFIRINESFGYATGDALLRAVARRLQVLVGTGGLAVRIGQDEFALCFEEISSPTEVRECAEQVRQALALPLFHEGRAFYLTASIGAVALSRDAVDAVSALEQADMAMQEARKRGRNTYCLAGPTPAPRRKLATHPEGALRKALEREELFLVYQPILNLHSRRLEGVEALLRWRHPESGVLTPDQFIPLANETGLIVDIGEWALAHACAQTSRWHEFGYPDLTLCVNFSPVQLQAHRVTHRIDAILERAGFAHSHLNIEFNSAGVPSEYAKLFAHLNELKESGVHLSLDNFGAGRFPIVDLGRLPVDSLKIDRTVVGTVAAEARGDNLVRALTLVGKSLGLNVEAEGVETRRQFNLIDQEGCDRAQGYLLSKPLDSDQILSLLRDSSRLLAHT